MLACGASLMRLHFFPNSGIIGGMSEFRLMQERLSRTALKDLTPVSLKTGVPVPTLYKIARGETKNPRVQTVEKITKYYRENP